MHRWLWLAGCGVLALCLASCKPQSPPVGGEAPGGATDVTTNRAEGVSASGGLPLRTNPASLAGRWGFLLLQLVPDQRQQMQFREMCLGLFEFRQDAQGQWDGKLLASIHESLGLKLDKLATDGTQVELELTTASGPLNFVGRFADGLVRGSIQTNEGLQPACLKPTTESTFGSWESAPVAPGMDLYMQAMKEKNQPSAIIAAARELRGNPLALDAFQAGLSRLPHVTTLTEEKVRAAVSDYVESAGLWGERMAIEALVTAATSVTLTRRLPQYALELVTQLEGYGAEKTARWQGNIRALREQTEVDIALQQIRSPDAESQAAGFAALKGHLTSQRYNSELLHALGEYSLKQGEKSAAQEYFADLVAIPVLEALYMKSREGQPPGDPSPRERLLTLWEEAHGNLDGFDDYLTEVYNRRIHEILDQAIAAAPEPVAAEAGNRTVLVELFTGAVCPPCVAGDLAADALLKTYPREKAVVLQYHQHIPGPDPLCNQDSEDRLSYYGIGGTPSVMVDGSAAPPPGVGGYIQHVPQAYSVLRAAVDSRLKTSTDITIAAAAAAENGELKVDVTVSGVPDDVLPQSRLRLALAEDQVEMLAPNGIRHHQMVVREMLGGAKGAGPRSGKLAYAVQMPLADLKQHLADYLQQFEVGRDFKFPDKPLKLKPLTLVAWVQNEQTQEVLHCVAVPVTGELRYPDEASAAEAPAAKSPASAADPANRAE